MSPIYLGIDFGLKHLGLAIADGPLARPLQTLDYGDEQTVFARLATMTDENDIEMIVIGLPEGKLDKNVREFGTKLYDVTGVSVVYHPETLSTQEAIAALSMAKASKEKKANDHVYAACLILEDYLETKSLKIEN